MVASGQKRGLFRRIEHGWFSPATDTTMIDGTGAGRNRHLCKRSLEPEHRTTFATADLMDAVVDAIAAARMDPRHDHLNKLLYDEVTEEVEAVTKG